MFALLSPPPTSNLICEYVALDININPGFLHLTTITAHRVVQPIRNADFNRRKGMNEWVEVTDDVKAGRASSSEVIKASLFLSHSSPTLVRVCENGDGFFVLLCAFMRVFVDTDAALAAQRKKQNKTQQWSNANCGKRWSKNAPTQWQIIIIFSGMTWFEEMG